MPFQNHINVQPAVAVAGDFASANPWSTLLSGAGKFVAGDAGLTEGLFCWIDGTDDYKLNNFGHTVPSGFVHREFRQQITTYLAEYGGLIQPGQEASASTSGDFWAKNTSAGSVTRGMKAYAVYDTGAVMFAAAGSPPAGASFTGVISSNVLTASAVTGTIRVGAPVTGSGVTAGAYIEAQLTGTPGGAGTYTVTSADVSSEAMTTTAAVETGWYAASTGATGELIKITKVLEG